MVEIDWIHQASVAGLHVKSYSSRHSQEPHLPHPPDTAYIAGSIQSSLLDELVPSSRGFSKPADFMWKP